MSLYALLRITAATEPDPVLGAIEIRRREHLDLSDPDAIADEVSTYEVRVRSDRVHCDDVGQERRATVQHRYGDGAWVLLRRALDAAVDLPDERDRHPGRRTS